MNLSEGKGRRQRCKEGLVDTVWEGDCGTNGKNSIHMCTLLGIIWMDVRSCCVAQGGQSGALMTWRDRMQGEEGSWRGRGRMCDYDWFALSYDRNKHTIAKKI